MISNKYVSWDSLHVSSDAKAKDGFWPVSINGKFWSLKLQMDSRGAE